MHHESTEYRHRTGIPGLNRLTLLKVNGPELGSWTFYIDEKFDREGNRAAANPRRSADRRRRHRGRRRQGYHRDATGRGVTAASKSTEVVTGNDPNPERTGCSAAEKLGDFDDTHHGRMNPEPHSARLSHR